jgi:hypothetical protein
MEGSETAMDRLCPPPGAESVAVVRGACVALSEALLGVIALGFGPLRDWLGVGAIQAKGGRSARSVDGGHEAYDGGLLDTWRLSRRLRQAGGARCARPDPDAVTPRGR